MNGQLTELLASPFAETALRLALLAVLVLLGGRGLSALAGQAERRLEQTTPDLEQRARLQTLVRAARAIGWVTLLVLAGLMTLHALGIDITPLLAGAGVAGLALSLGAQTLIKDYLGGVLILVENQFTIGDVIKVNDVAGGVERITLRVTHLRDLEGRLHVVPNGDIRTVSNLTAEWARAVVNLNVEHTADMSQVMRALETASAQVNEDDTVRADLLEPPQAVGWIGLNDWAVQVRLMAKTLPGKQWAVMMALRKRALQALKAEGVRVALPAQEIRWTHKTPVGELS